MYKTVHVCMSPMRLVHLISAMMLLSDITLQFMPALYMTVRLSGWALPYSTIVK